VRPKTQQVITAPAAEPITTAEAKAYLRVDLDDDDTAIAGLISAARSVAETETQRALLRQTIEAKYADWPEHPDGFWLPAPPLVSVTGVYYYDADGTEQTLSTSVYEVDTSSEPGRVALKPGQSWPTLQAEKHLPIRIRYTAGYADAAALATAHPQVKQGVYMCVADWYDPARANLVDSRLGKEPPYAAKILFGQCAAAWGW
jgi:uncharacterized phiE125 gp8 family phage protein